MKEPERILGEGRLPSDQGVHRKGVATLESSVRVRHQVASAESYRILTATETGTQEVSLEDVQALTETEPQQLERMSSNPYSLSSRR